MIPQGSVDLGILLHSALTWKDLDQTHSSPRRLSMLED
jgi:hypothetical protein